MRMLLLVLSVVTIPFAGMSQSVKVGVKNTAVTIEVPRVNIDLTAHDVVYVRMSYAGWQIENPEALKVLEGRPIERVQLCYTDYPPGKDLQDLHRKRLASLFIEAPHVFNERYAEWQMVKQTQCTSEWEASRMFHGFIIKFRPEGSEATARAESSYVRSYVEDMNFPRHDSTILKIMERKEAWKDMLVVADLTGSMSPYIAQLLLWMKLTMDDSKVRHMVFFNDGDRLPDDQKEIGRTGGIYGTLVDSLEQVLELAEQTMMNGYGGDAPENNIEALLYGMDKWSNHKEVVMIADNFATPRDMELLTEVKVPVRVVLCGTFAGINPAYLQIARETGGSLHTMEEDIEDLMSMKEGSKVTIGKQTFLIQKGRFLLISSS